MNKQCPIQEIEKILNECCNTYDEKGNHIGNKCSHCECWDDTNNLCCSYNSKQAEALYNAGYRKVKQGKWIQVDDTKCRCNNCDVITLIAQYPRGNKDYCPNCGADMRGE